MKQLIAFFSRYIPRHHQQKIAHIILSLLSPFYRGNKITDPIDGKTYRKLLPYGQLVKRNNALAPLSMSLERHRLIWLYLKEKTDFFTKEQRFLHVAPEYCFLRKFKKLNNLDYVTGDLISPWADVKMDVHAIPFGENEFDVAMCNHVFEHVEDDKKAMSEFFRVLKPGGWAIFQVPIDRNREETYEDSTITDPKEREKHFWQHDHVRLYGRDYGKKLAAVGFKVTESNYVDEIGTDLFNRYALPEGEIIYICKKPEQNQNEELRTENGERI
ncbi:MAG: class I SAM-dependent methyltransferase [Salinivirgaceae bacterium]|nr:class I SAM-dependent methyltransferase [Salinivirgaceae bacterium]